MTPAEFEQEAAFLAELEDYLKSREDTEGLLLVIRAHAQLQLMLEPEHSPAQVDRALSLYEREIDMLRGQNDELHRQINYIRSLTWDEIEPEQIVDNLRHMLDRPKEC
jgi:hypothetical protein